MNEDNLPTGILIDRLFNPNANRDFLRTDECPKKDTAYDCTNVPTELHTCPFREDVNDDSETLCTCCENCQHGCAQDI